MADETKVRVYRVHRAEFSRYWVTPDWDAIQDAEFDGSEDGDRITIELASMTQAEIDALPEFEGW